MSGGRLIVLDRIGRANKQFEVLSGLVTLGSDPSCDVRILLPSVDSHHATIVVHTKETVIHNVGSGETLVNGASVSVAPLRQDDVVSVGGRELRWRYTRPAPHHTRERPHTPVLQCVRRGRARVPARRSDTPPTRAPQAPYRNSTPGAVSTRQVAIVQPQRRDTSNRIDTTSSSTVTVETTIRRRKTSKSDIDMNTSTDKAGENRSKTKSPRNSQVNLQNTTKATLWIESRKTSPRKSVKESPSRPQVTPRRALSAKKSTPLRLTVLKKAQSAHKMRITKIEAPSKIDHTKQAAILLMTGHTPRKKTSPKQTGVKAPSFVVKKRSPVKSPRKSNRQTKNVSTNSVINKASSSSPYNSRNTTKKSDSLSVIEIQDSDIQQSSSLESDLSAATTSSHSSILSNPKKSALKDPAAKRNSKKTDSIKFDLSNLEKRASNSIDVLTVTDSTQRSDDGESSEDDISLHYLDSSPASSPSPRKPLYSRSSKILERTLGTPITKNTDDEQLVVTPESPQSRKSLRGNMMLQKVLQSPNNTANDSHKTTSSDYSWTRPTVSGNKNETLTLRPLDKNKMESYSIVDLVSNDSSQSVYNSVSDMSMVQFNTPLTSSERNMRSLKAENLLASSTPLKYNVISKAGRSQSLIQHRSYNTSPGIVSITNNLTRRSKSLSTPVNIVESESFGINSESNESPSQLNIKRGSRAANGSRKSYQTTTASDNSKENMGNKVLSNFKLRKSLATPKDNETFIVSVKGRKNKSVSTPVNITGTVKNIRKSKASQHTDLTNTDKITRSKRSGTRGSPLQTGMSTPENHNSPEDLGTPVLRIQSLLDGTANLTIPRQSKKGVARIPLARKTISGRWSTPRKRDAVVPKIYMEVPRTSLRRSQKILDISPNHGDTDLCHDDGDTTPKSAVKLIQEGVKNKHSTAKQPKSKRSIIDNLNESDIVKQLFNSPVKRKLSQSMIEFSRKQFLDDEATPHKKLTRNTIALVDRATDDSLMEQTQAFTPEIFVSPLSTPSNSPNLIGLKRLFAKGTPENDLRDVRGVGKLMKTPRNRKFVKNDLSDVAGVKLLFARSPRNRLSDVRIKSLFAKSPENNLKNVTGVRTLYRSQRKDVSPNNDLRDVAGVRNLYMNKSPRNDLRNVSGVKTSMRVHSPKNDLSDLEGVRNIFRREKDAGLNNISGIEELFSESQQAFSLIDTNAESSFDLLIGKPAVKAYPKAKSLTDTSVQKKKVRQGLSLQTSFSLINDDVENWLENELKKRMHTASCSTQSPNDSENNLPSSSSSNRILRKNTKDNSRNKSHLITPTKSNNTFAEDPQSISSQSKTSTRNIVSKINTSVRKSRTINEVTSSQSLNKSKNKTNLSRELLKLAIDTVEGNTPVLSSRIRNSSLNKVTELKKSTSEIYGAHTLPIKKRSLVDTSKRSSEKNTLPIKKRVVVHSTPVKPRFNVTASTLNATDIGNVSPIAATNETDELNTFQTTGNSNKTPQKQQDLSSDGPKATPVRSRKTKPHPKDVQIESQSTQPSPRNKETDTFSPIQTRRTRLKTKTSIGPVNVKKGRKSIVITKKSPDFRPNLNETGAIVKLNPTTKVLKRKKTQEVSPDDAESIIKKTRRKNVQSEEPVENEQTNASTSNQKLIKTRSSRRQRVAIDEISNKATRAKASNVNKHSPQSKPRSSKNSKTNASDNSSEARLRKTRRTVAEVQVNKLEFSKQKRNSKKLTQNGESKETSQNSKTSGKSIRNKKGVFENLTMESKRAEQIKENKTNSRIGTRNVTQNSQDKIQAGVSQTRSTRKRVVNKSPVVKTDEKDKTGAPKPVTVKETIETVGRGRKRKLESQKSAEEHSAKMIKSDVHDDVTKSNRRRKVEKESLENNVPNTRSKQIKNSNKLETNEKLTVRQSTRGNQVGNNNRGTIKTKSTQNTNTKNKTAVREESAKCKIENKRSTTNTKPKPEKKTEKNVSEAKTSRGNKTSEPAKPKTRQQKRKTDNSVTVSEVAPESSKRSVIGTRVTRVTRARAVVDEIDGQKPAARSRRR